MCTLLSWGRGGGGGGGGAPSYAYVLTIEGCAVQQVLVLGEPKYWRGSRNFQLCEKGTYLGDSGSGSDFSQSIFLSVHVLADQAWECSSKVTAGPEWYLYKSSQIPYAYSRVTYSIFALLSKVYPPWLQFSLRFWESQQYPTATLL